MTSVAQYAKGPISIHVLHDESLHELAKARLAEIAREMQVEFSLVPVALPSTINAQRLRQFGPASLFRLMIPALFADEPVVIYLDSDLVANGLDIADLAAAASETAAISAVRDPNIAAPERHAQELSRMSLDPAEYVNSGVLVFRPKLISVDLLEQFSEFSEKNPAAIHPDQDFINSYFMGRIHFLDDRFNFQVALYDRAMLRPLSSYAGKIVHYAGKIKPLDGNLAPGLLPFFIHAYRVRELSEGLLYEAQRYLLPVDGNADALTMMRVDGRSG
jgi:lipopolysaccharide biosynthesis glycosyltransferase